MTKKQYQQAKYWILTIPAHQYAYYLPPNCVWIRGQLERGEGKKLVTSKATSSNSKGKQPAVSMGRLLSSNAQSTSILSDHENMESSSSRLCNRSNSKSPEPYVGGGDGTGDATTKSGYLHWQLVVCFERKVRLKAVRATFGPFHAEPTRSDAASEYVWKDDTYVEGTRFELGKLPIKRGDTKDWARILDAAKTARFDDIPPDVLVRYYSSIKKISAEYCEPLAIERKTVVYWGPTEYGKSKRAWEEATLKAYPKDPRSKFWDGYRDQQNVVIDEFRGGIDIAHMLRWTDRYPVIVEIKGSSVVLQAKRIWITSNIPPREWWPNLDEETLKAFLRRVTVFQFCKEIGSEEVLLINTSN